MHESVGDIESHLPVLRRFAFALAQDADTAEVLVQNCIARAVERIDQFERGTNLRAWLFTILCNLHLDDSNRTARSSNVLDVDGAPVSAFSEPPLQGQGTDLLEFAACFASLAPGDQDVVRLIVIEGMSYADVAGVLGLPVGTVKSRLSRARARLRQLYPIH